MKITEITIVPSKISDTTSCGTTSSGQPVGSDTTSSGTTSSGRPTGLAQDIVSQDIIPETINGHIVCQPDHSAITEGVSQIMRRVAGKGLKPGFRCTSGPRKGRIVAKPSTCFMKRDPVKGTKIKRKRQQKARQAGRKMGITKRSKGVSRRLKTVQVAPHRKASRKISSKKKLQKSGGGLGKSKIVKSRK
jgi:hypothetical protein